MKNSATRFIVFNLIGFLLLASWLWQPTRMWWDGVDQKVFFALNGSLAEHYWWQVVIAIMNFRPFDFIALAIMITPFLVPGWLFEKEETAMHFLRLIVLLTFMIISRIALSELLNIHRQSPSLVLQPVNLLHELVPYIPAKDQASGSFPGDHAAVILSWFLYMWLFAKPKCRLPVILISITFVLPRLIGGAHWFTDDVVGGIFLAFFSVAWVCYTPLGLFCAKKMLPVYHFVVRKVVIFPGFARFK